MPAYRGTAYVVFENLALERFGHRLPQLSFEVFRPSQEPDSAEQLVRTVNIIPSAGEFVYATEPVTRSLGDGVSEPENFNSTLGVSDFLVSLDQFEASLPNCGSASLVVAWFGNERGPLRDQARCRGQREDDPPPHLVGERSRARRRA